MKTTSDRTPPTPGVPGESRLAITARGPGALGRVFFGRALGLALLGSAFLGQEAAAGEITAWGSNASGQVLGVPQLFSRIVAGDYDGFALDQHGSISGWGDDGQGQLSGIPTGSCFSAVSSSLRGFACALRADGSIAAWGEDGYGQVTGAPTGSGYLAIDAGDDWVSCALRADGSPVVWGLGTLLAPNISGFTAVAVGNYTGYGLAADGSIVAWDCGTGEVLATPTGNGFQAIAASGQIVAALAADGSIVVLKVSGGSLVPAAGDLSPPSGSGFTRIDVIAKGGLLTDQVVIALAADGSIVAWGTSILGLISKAPTGDGFIDVAAAPWGMYALTGDGTIVSWSDWVPFPKGTLPNRSDYTAVAAGQAHALALGADGAILAWGSDEGVGLVSDAPLGTGYTAIATGGTVGVALALDANGRITAWGHDGWGQVSGAPPNAGFTAIATGQSHSYALDTAGWIVGWGDDISGQVTGAPGGTTFTAIAAGSQFGCALAPDGSISAWGSDFLGSVSGAPTGTGFTAIAAARENGFALDANGAIVVWGPEGPLSDVPTGDGFTAISVNGNVGYALAADGSIRAWGDDSAGQVSNAPTGVGFTAIAAGALNGYAISPGRSFVPGARLRGEPTAIGESLTLSFLALQGTKLKLAFPESNTALKSRVTLRDDQGAVVKTWKVKHDKKSKGSPKLKRTGIHTLTVETLSGTPGPFEILTSAKLPASAKPAKAVKKGKKDQKEVTFEVLALPCAKVATQFTLAGFFEQMALSVSRPDGTSLSVTTSLDAGVLTVAPFHALDVGAYRFTIKGFGSDAKGKVKAALDPQQPPPGQGTVLFP